MSLRGRRTCASASALNLEAQPAQAERVVSRISLPVFGIGMNAPCSSRKKDVFRMISAVTSQRRRVPFFSHGDSMRSFSEILR